MPRPRASCRSHPKSCGTVFLQGALSLGSLSGGRCGCTQAPSPAPPALLLSVALGPGAPGNTELGMEVESASRMSPLSFRFPSSGGPRAQWPANRGFLPSWTMGRGAPTPPGKAPPVPSPVSRPAHGQHTHGCRGLSLWPSLAAEGSSLHAAPLRTDLCWLSTPCVDPAWAAEGCWSGHPEPSRGSSCRMICPLLCCPSLPTGEGLTPWVPG